MKATTRKRLLIAGGGVVGVFLLLAHFKERDSYSCQTCGSTRDEIQWRVGLWPDTSVPLTPKLERIHETRFFHDFLPGNHVHQWRFAQGSPYYFFGTTWGGCAIGGGRRFSEISRMYDSSPEFREFVQAKLKDGSLVKSNLLTLVAASANESEARTNERVFLETFYNK
jgi:hypothetical protein